MTNDEYISGAPIYTKRVTHTVFEGEDNEIERSYSIVSCSDVDETVYIESGNDFMEIPKADIQLLINALTDFIK